MAGNHVYLEPILAKATGGLDQIVQNIDENVTAEINKLDEVANLLTQILYQSGLTQQQYVINGATLSGLELNSLGYTDCNYNIMKSFKDISLAGNTGAFIGEHCIRGRGSATAHFYIDLTDVNSITFDNIGTTNSSSSANRTYSVKIDDIQVFTYASNVSNQRVSQTIDTSTYSGLCKITFICDVSHTSNASAANYENITFHASGGDFTILNKQNVLKFSSNNIICSTDIDGAAAEGFITIPLASLTISQLNTLLTIGELDGIEIHNYKTNYEKLINNLALPVGSLNQNVDFTNLYLGIKFLNTESKITSFTVRYV